MTLLDPSYAKKYIPIIASVSEHQSTTWTTFFFDLHFLLIFTPLGLYHLFTNKNRKKLFLALYFLCTIYFASLMVRLILILFPAVCIISAIGISELIHSVKKKLGVFQISHFTVLLTLLGWLIFRFMCHGSIVGAEIYSSPSVVLANRNFKTGQKYIIDDFRDAYYWLRQNTPKNSKILSWWDYGYQIAGFSDRTTIVDNNTWNFEHIATVGKVFASNEDEAYEILQNLEVDYVIVLFGGRSGFSGDDINKFIWMVRITGNIFPYIKEGDYINKGF